MNAQIRQLFANERDVLRYCSGQTIGNDAADGGAYLGMFRGVPLFTRALTSLLVLDAQPNHRRAGSLTPSIVLDEENSLIVADPDGEAFLNTAGKRSDIGLVFCLDWMGSDRLRDEDSDVVYPSWNPLSERWLCAAGPKRDAQLRTIARHLARAHGPEAVKFLETMFHAALALRAAHADARVAPRLPAIPQHWLFREASLPMVYDWLGGVERQVEALKLTMEGLFAGRSDAGANPYETAVDGLRAFARMSAAKRRQIVEAVREALGFCADVGTRERLAASTFSASDLRGVPTVAARRRERERVMRAAREGHVYSPRYQPGEMRPVTVYAGSGPAAFGSAGVLTSLFVEVSGAMLSCHKPNTLDEHRRQYGPHGVMIHVEAVDRLPTIDILPHLPALPADRQVAVTLYADTLTTLRGRYGENAMNEISAALGATILCQDNTANVSDDIRLLIRALDAEAAAAIPKGARVIVVRPPGHGTGYKPIVGETWPWWMMESCQDVVFNPETYDGLEPPPPCPGAQYP